MSRIIFSFLLGSMIILMSSLPSIASADKKREGHHDRARQQSKIIGKQGKQGTGITERQDLRVAGRADRDLRNRTLERDQANLARYSAQYNSYYGLSGYPTTSSYYGTYGYPTSVYNNYYGAYGYPTGLSNTYYGTYGYPTSLYDTSYGAYGYPTSLYDTYYDTYNYPSSLSSTYPIYSNPYVYPGYNPYYNPGMYNPNTIFVNPPSSLNYPSGYPGYSETYLYR